MTKKEFMLQVIDFLPNWKLGWGLKALIQNDQLEPDVFEKLYEIFKDWVHKTYSEMQKAQFKQKMEKVEEMKKKEKAHKENESEDLDAMLTSL